MVPSDDRCLDTQCAMDNSHIDVDVEAYVWFGGVVVRFQTSDSEVAGSSPTWTTVKY